MNKLFSQGVKEVRRISMTNGEKHSVLANLNAYIKEHPAQKESAMVSFFKYLRSLVWN